MWDSAVVGEPLDLGFQFQPFSSDKTVAACWAEEADVVVHAKSTLGGADIAKLSKFPRQSEVLLPPGLGYMVVGKRTETIVLGKGRNRRTIEINIIEVEIFDDR